MFFHLSWLAVFFVLILVFLTSAGWRCFVLSFLWGVSHLSWLAAFFFLCEFCCFLTSAGWRFFFLLILAFLTSAGWRCFLSLFFFGRFSPQLVGGVRAAPAVDGLVLVANDKDSAAPLREETKHRVLDAVGILGGGGG